MSILEKWTRIDGAATNYANLFRSIKIYIPTYGLTETEIYAAMRKAIDILEDKK